MARLLHSLRKTLAGQLHPQQALPFLHVVGRNISARNPLCHFPRFYISDMRKSAFEGNILRLLRHEIQYELESSPSKQPVAKFDSFMIDDQPGERWIRLKRKFGDEDIKVEATMFDGAAPAPNASGGGAIGEDMQLHITLIAIISKGEGGGVLEIVCSAWPDSIEITRVFMRTSQKMLPEPYTGPEFKELDDELQDSLYDFLEVRGIDDKLASFLHEYMKSKGKTELIRWMGTVKSCIERKKCD